MKMKRKRFQVMLLTALLIFGLCFGAIPKYDSITNGFMPHTVYAEEDDEDYEDDEDDWSDEESDEEEASDEDTPVSGDAALQVIQVMAKGKNPITGELYDMDKFVAGKSTVIRAQFAEER